MINTDDVEPGVLSFLENEPAIDPPRNIHDILDLFGHGTGFTEVFDESSNDTVLGNEWHDRGGNIHGVHVHCEQECEALCVNDV